MPAGRLFCNLIKAVRISFLQEEYIKLVSHFKLETSIKDEVAEFSGGLNEVSFSGKPTHELTNENQNNLRIQDKVDELT